MRYLYFLLIALLSLFSCKKTTNSDNSPAEKGNMLISVSRYVPDSRYKTTIAFTYDQDEQVAQIRRQHHDTLTDGTQFIDTSLMIFTGGGPSTPPSAYDITWTKGTDAQSQTSVEHHLLYYDNRQRVVEDSMSSSTTGLNIIKFTYSDGNIICNQYGSFGSLDTLFLINGNMNRRATYNTSYHSGIMTAYLHEIETFGYSAYSNPLFQKDIANSLGALLTVENLGDYLSVNLMNQYQYTFSLNYIPPVTSYSWTTDDAGRVIRGTGTDLSTGQVSDYYTFQYQ
jgi:hypothetical protein